MSAAPARHSPIEALRKHAGALLDGDSNTVTASVAVGGPSRGLAVNAVTNRIYVARSLSADVVVIDGATNAIIATVALAVAVE